ncbi:MAG: M16 family metallopeptidase [Planctomycetota bacterium]|jgi:predicted Zn-dependent peptidase
MLRIVPVILWFLFPLLAGAQFEAGAVKRFDLDNGMRFLVLEDHSIPNANMYLWWRVGSRNEGPGLTGLSHFFEHMMFNGAKKYGPKEFDRVMEEGGGSNNAWTSEDVTVYTDWFPSGALELIFELEADRVGSLSFESKMIESERSVVLSERITSRENSKWSLLDEHVKASAFMAHPYRWPVLGYESDIRNWKRGDLTAYFQTYYAPNNCTAVIVGDVKFDRVIELAKKHFGPIPEGPPPRPVHTVEPPQRGERRVTVIKDVSAPVIMMAYHAPEARSADFHAVDLLAGILGEGRSARLYASIVEGKELAVEAETYFSHSIDPTLFYIWVECREGIAANAAERAVDAEIGKIVKEGVTEAEVEKIRRQRLVGLYRQMETINGKANLLGKHEIFFGGFEKAFTASEAYAGVTREDVARVAKAILQTKNRTVGTMARRESK